MKRCSFMLCTILLLSVAFLDVSFATGAGQKADTKETSKKKDSSKKKKGARWEGRLRQQTEIEEEGLDDWKPPTGDELAFTQDWVGPFTAVFEEHLGHLKGLPNVRGLEIGSFEGRSAIWFAENILTGRKSKLTCVDLFGERLHAFFDHNIKVSGQKSKIAKVTGKSQEQLYRMGSGEVFDFAYIDGCHLATCAVVDIVLSWNLLKTDGILIIDDYTWEGPPLDRPKMAIDAFLEIFQPHYELLHKRQHVIVRKKSAGY